MPKTSRLPAALGAWAYPSGLLPLASCSPPPSTSPATVHLSMRGIVKPADLPFPESTPGPQDSTPCLGNVKYHPPLPVVSLWPSKSLLSRSLCRYHLPILTPSSLLSNCLFQRVSRGDTPAFWKCPGCLFGIQPGSVCFLRLEESPFLLFSGRSLLVTSAKAESSGWLDSLRPGVFYI